jgi:hypothetical protein
MELFAWAAMQFKKLAYVRCCWLTPIILATQGQGSGGWGFEASLVQGQAAAAGPLVCSPAGTTGCRVS